MAIIPVPDRRKKPGIRIGRYLVCYSHRSSTCSTRSGVYRCGIGLRSTRTPFEPRVKPLGTFARPPKRFTKLMLMHRPTGPNAQLDRKAPLR